MNPKFLTVLLMSSISAAFAEDAVLRAMKDEMERSMRKLQLENLQKPYFISYRVVEMQNCNITASFGAVTNSFCEPTGDGKARSRNFSVDVRVGDYARDNTNFFAPMATAGVVRVVQGGGSAMPIDDNYDEIRRQLWIATDSAYKNALDTFAKKKAALENRTRTDDVPDFSKEDVVKMEEPAVTFSWNRAELEGRVKALSALFREAPGIDGSTVNLYERAWLVRFLNSEGTSYVRSISTAGLTINADAQALDGMPISDFDVIQANSIAELPSRDEIVKRIRGLQARLENLRKAPLLERYTGPVLFEGQAAGELFLQAMAPALAAVPRVVVDDLRFERAYNSNGGFLDRVGSKVLPSFMSVTDDPSAHESGGQPLFGGYAVDDDGVAPHPTVLIEKGTLKALLHTRALIPGTTHSTASRRGNGPMPSNLLIRSDKSMSSNELKAELLRLAKERGNDYGIIVRRMSNPTVQTSRGRTRVIIMTRGDGPGNIEVEPLIEAYKVFPDGHEELVRNLSIHNLTFGSFKDIAAVSDSTAVYTAQVRMIIRSPAMGMNFSMPGGPNVVSIATPALLFDDLALQRPVGEVPNLPFTKHPYFDK